MCHLIIIFVTGFLPILTSTESDNTKWHRILKLSKHFFFFLFFLFSIFKILELCDIVDASDFIRQNSRIWGLFFFFLRCWPRHKGWRNQNVNYLFKYECESVGGRRNVAREKMCDSLLVQNVAENWFLRIANQKK